MNKSILIALSIFLLLVLWLASGLIIGNGEKNESEPGENLAESGGQVPLLSVRVRQQQAQTVVREIVIHGKTDAARKVMLKAETAGSIIRIGADRGALVKKGDLIAAIEMRDRDKQLAQAEAVLKQRRLEFDASRDLAEKGYQAETKLAESYASLEAARLQVETFSIDIEKTRILAPFDGVLGERYIEEGDYLQAADPVGLLLELDPLIIKGKVTEREVEALRIGITGKAELASGDIVQGRLRYMAPFSDEESRTYVVEIEVSNAGSRIPAGLTGLMYIPVETTKAHYLSPALLSLNDQGVLGIKIVDENDTVLFIPAQLVKAETKGVWLSGLPEVARVITVGQGFARDGDRVITIQDSESVLPVDLEDRQRIGQVQK